MLPSFCPSPFAAIEPNNTSLTPGFPECRSPTFQQTTVTTIFGDLTNVTDLLDTPACSDMIVADCPPSLTAPMTQKRKRSPSALQWTPMLNSVTPLQNIYLDRENEGKRTATPEGGGLLEFLDDGYPCYPFDTVGGNDAGPVHMPGAVAAAGMVDPSSVKVEPAPAAAPTKPSGRPKKYKKRVKRAAGEEVFTDDEMEAAGITP